MIEKIVKISMVNCKLSFSKDPGPGNLGSFSILLVFPLNGCATRLLRPPLPLTDVERLLLTLFTFISRTVDPLSVVARPSSNCVYILPTPPGHTPIASVEYHPEGKYLLSSSARDSSVLIWSSASEQKIPLKCINRFNDGIQLASW